MEAGSNQEEIKEGKIHEYLKDEECEKYISRANEISYLLQEPIINRFTYGDIKWGNIVVGLNNFIGTFNPFPEVGWGIYKWNLILKGNEYLKNVKKLEVHMTLHIHGNYNFSKNKAIECMGLIPSNNCKAFNNCSGSKDLKSIIECQKIQGRKKGQERQIKINNCPYTIPLIFSDYDISSFEKCSTNFTEPDSVKDNLLWIHEAMKNKTFHSSLNNKISKTSNFYIASWFFENIDLSPAYEIIPIDDSTTQEDKTNKLKNIKNNFTSVDDKDNIVSFFKGNACGTAILKFDKECDRSEIPISLHVKFSFSGGTSLWKTITPDQIVHYDKIEEVFKENKAKELVIIPAYHHINKMNIRRGIEEYESDKKIGLLMKTGIPNVSLRAITLDAILNKFKKCEDYVESMYKVGREIGEDFGENFWKNILDMYLFERGIRKDKKGIPFKDILEYWADYDADAGMGRITFPEQEEYTKNFKIYLINSFLVVHEYKEKPQCNFLSGYFEGVITELSSEYYNKSVKVIVKESLCASQNKDLMNKISKKYYTEPFKLTDNVDLVKEIICKFNVEISFSN